MGAPSDEEVYDNVQDICDNISVVFNKNTDKEQFLRNFRNKEEFDKMFNYLRFCFQRVNEVSYNLLENKKLPSDIRYVMCGMSLMYFSIRLEVCSDELDHSNKNLFYHIGLFATNNITKDVALKIIQQQEEIEELYRALHLDWEDLQLAA